MRTYGLIMVEECAGFQLFKASFQMKTAIKLHANREGEEKPRGRNAAIGSGFHFLFFLGNYSRHPSRFDVNTFGTN